MADSYFLRLDETSTSGRYVAGPATAGPWAPNLQHGGPPNCLAVTAAERAVQAETGRTDLIGLRVAAEFVGPVPVGEVETRARVVRAARSAALAEVILTAQGRDCLQVRVWFVRDADTAPLSAPAAAPTAVPDAGPGLDADFGYGASLEWRFVRGAMAEPGPAAAWVCPRTALLDDHDMSGLARVALIADSASGISAELDWSVWSFLNVDLDVHLARPVEGEWVLMDAVTHLGGHGSALARSTLSDARGLVGSGLQTLVVAPMRT
ncbi:MAG TPA: thioesterase family protein [Jatrophihabitans sp.]|nr:thioesterase family protein [Jatrophihabitans sp.]